MPTTSLSRLFNNQQHQRCTCQKEDTTMITRWFPIIRRRSSSSSSSTYNEENINNSRRASTDSIIEIENKHVKEFLKMYDLAIDEMNYAIESQGSIYYDGDFLTATEAVDNCLESFRELMQIMNRDRSYELQQQWTDTLFALRTRLDNLPYPTNGEN